MKRLLLLSFLTVCWSVLAAESQPLSIKFDSTEGWGKTKSTTFQAKENTATLDGTNWDSKIFRTIKLLPDTSYKVKGTGRGKVIIGLYQGFYKKNIFNLNLSGANWRSGEAFFRTPPKIDSYLLSIQVNAGKGRGEVKDLTFVAAEPQPLVIKFDSTEGWGKTPSTTFQVKDDSAVLDGTNWDSKIYRKIQLVPNTCYKMKGTGRGKITVTLSASTRISQLDLSGPNWSSDENIFTTPQKVDTYFLVIKVNAGKGRGEVKDLSFTPASKLQSTTAIPALTFLCVTRRTGRLSKTLWQGLSMPGFRLSFDVKILKTQPGQGHYFGMNCVGPNKKTLQLFSRGGSMTWYKEGREVSVGRFAKPMKEGSEASPTSFTMSVNSDGFIEINADKRLVGSINCDFLPLQSITFFSVNADVEFTNIKLEAIKPVVRSTALHQSLDVSFDGSLEGILDGKEHVSPVTAEGVSFVDGFGGKAVLIDRQKNKKVELSYNVSDFFCGDSGSISFWFRPKWDGTDKGNHLLIKGFDASGKTRLNFWVWYWIRADLSRNEADSVMVARMLRNAFFSNDWHQLALTWNAKGWVKIYFDGLPYRHGDHWMPTGPVRIGSLGLQGIKTISIGSPSPSSLADGSFRNLTVLSQAPSDREIAESYRRQMPLDILMDRSFYFTDRDSVAEIQVAPFGFFTRPQPVAPVPVKTNLKLSLFDSKGALIKSREFKLDLSKANSDLLKFSLGKLPVGEYKICCEAGERNIRRSFPISVVNPEPARQPSDDPLKLAPPLFDLTLAKASAGTILHDGPVSIQTSKAGTYLEGPNSNGARFSVPIHFPNEVLGKPVLLEISWPDDKPRSMGLYMHQKAKTGQQRDCLQGGLQSGMEYPESGTMLTAKYLFYPIENDYLFEARTMITGYPAAVSRIRVSPVEGNLPHLAVRHPAGLPGRTLGHMDEDQTIFTNFVGTAPRSDVQAFNNQVFNHIGDYFDYTGQSVISYPVMRYDYVCFPLDNFYGGGFPSSRTGTGDFIASLGRRNIRFYVIFNLYTLPDFALSPEKIKEMTAKDYFLVNSDGKMAKLGHLQLPKPDFENPAVRKMLLWYIRQIALRYNGIKGFSGFDFWSGLLTRTLTEGYGDASIRAFEKGTGIHISAKTPEERFAVLTGPALRQKWLQWRADRTASLIKDIVACVKSVNPDLSVRLQMGGVLLNGSPQEESSEKIDVVSKFRDDYSLDLNQLHSIKGLQIAPMVFSNSSRAQLWWGGARSTEDEVTTDFARFTQLIPPDKKISCSIYPKYFETFRDTLNPKVFKGYFQNADVKPQGRYFLKQLIYPLAMLDAQRIQIGAQPVGTLGRDDETREFAKAYCALPALPFDNVEGVRDPVLARSLKTSNGTYLYLANILWGKCVAHLSLKPAVPLFDLSTGKTLTPSGDGSIEITLKPYQLRSFLLKQPGTIAIALQKVDVPDSVKKFYANHLTELEDGLKLVAESGEDVTKLRACVTAIKSALDHGAYAEAHRLIFSKLMYKLAKLRTVAKSGKLKQKSQMLAKSAYAVDCGSNDFLTTSTGKLFLPDQAFDGVYGYLGSHKTVARSIARIADGVEFPGLYAYEAYDLDNYKFKVAPGSYTVRIRFKIGYEPNAKPGKNVIDLDINGRKVLHLFDIYKELGSDFNKVLVKDFKGVKPKDGFIDLKFSIPPNGDSTVRFCDSIEIIPQ